MSKKERVKSKNESNEPIEKEVFLSSVKDSEVSESLEVKSEDFSDAVDKVEPLTSVGGTVELKDYTISGKKEIIGVLKEPFYVLDDIEKHIEEANKLSNHQLASELHKVHAILCDLNHTFNHLGGEAKLVTSISLKNGKILKC